VKGTKKGGGGRGGGGGGAGPDLFANMQADAVAAIAPIRVSSDTGVSVAWGLCTGIQLVDMVGWFRLTVSKPMLRAPMV